VFVVGVALGGAASGAFNESGGHERSDRFWSLAQVRGMPAEWYDSLTSMALAADAIVVGRVGLVTQGREWRPNDAEWSEREPLDPLMARFANLTVETWDVIGTLPPRASASEIVIEMFLREADLLPMLQAAVPRERAVFFLRSKADAPEFFRLVNDEQGLIRDIGGESHVVGASDSRMLVEVNGLPFDQLLGQLRSILQQG